MNGSVPQASFYRRKRRPGWELWGKGVQGEKKGKFHTDIRSERQSAGSREERTEVKEIEQRK